MNLGQRVVLSLALAAVLAVVAGTLSTLLVDSVDGGWFMYEPDTNVLASGSSDGDAVRVAAVWLIAIAFWFIASWRLFRTRDE